MNDGLEVSARVHQLHGVDRARFEQEVADHYHPVVLRGVAAHWPAVVAARDSDEALVRYIAARDSGRPVTVLTAPPEVQGRYFYNEDLRGMNFRSGKLPLAALLDRLLAERGNAAAPGFYAGSAPTAESISAFAAENPLPFETRGVDPRIWVGNASRIAPHYDMSPNIAVVVAGRRRFTLFPPDQIGNLYIGPVDRTVAGQPTSMVDPHAPDLDRFPRYAEALHHALVAELEPGDGIYIPALWWHGVRADAPLNVLVNYWYGEEKQFPFAALMLAMQSLRDLPTAERTAWKSWFDHYVFGDDARSAVEHLPDYARGVLAPPSPARDRMILDYVVGMLKRAT